MEARNKSIEKWFSLIDQGQIVLPRFQRHEAWSRAQIVGLLENILREPGLPIGALLTLDVGDRELFHSRPIVGAPEPDGKPAMHLLDGQQRLTALWRSLTGTYKTLNLFVSLEGQSEEEIDDIPVRIDAPSVEIVKRYDRKGIKQPVWCDSPAEVLKRGQVPAEILCPGVRGEAAYKTWKEDVRKHTDLDDENIERISTLRQRVANYGIPFLSLGVETGRETALNVFIKMNTSASPLKDFDIVVAQLEAAAGESLHDLVAELLDEVPGISDYGKVEDNVLSVAALLMDKAPLKKNYLDPEFGHRFTDIWGQLKHGFKHGIEFLHSEKILNEKCLPSDVVVYLVCALWAHVPEHGLDHGGNARTLIRKALWRASYTSRYGKTSATRAYADYKTLKRAIAGEAGVDVELFDETYYPLPEIEELKLAGWPGRKDRLPRAILVTGLRRGGLDFADGAPVTSGNFGAREYHHLYPVGILGGNREDERVNRALNCALITWKTNRKVGAKTPEEYIRARTDASHLGEADVRSRLASHCVPYEALIANDYEGFLDARAADIHRDMVALCNGSNPQ